MPKFSVVSKAKLATCDERLQRVFNVVIQHRDCQVLEGHRGQVDQDAAFVAGRSKLMWPHGQHNAIPSRAIDVAPYPIDWHDRERFLLFAGFVLGVATMMGIKLRYGGDWDGDGVTSDEKFSDLPHFEIADGT